MKTSAAGRNSLLKGEWHMEKSDGVTDLRFGFWSALGAAVTTAITFAMAILTPPMSGQLCVGDCFRYPYLEVAARFPRDYYWLFPASLSILAFLAFMVALAGRARAAAQPFTRLGLVLGAMGGLTLLGDYYLLLPSTRGHSAESAGRRVGRDRAAEPVQPTRRVHRARRTGLPADQPGAGLHDPGALDGDAPRAGGSRAVPWRTGIECRDADTFHLQVWPQPGLPVRALRHLDHLAGVDRRSSSRSCHLPAGVDSPWREGRRPCFRPCASSSVASTMTQPRIRRC
jgi:hypothetical protein